MNCKSNFGDSHIQETPRTNSFVQIIKFDEFALLLNLLIVELNILPIDLFVSIEYNLGSRIAQCFYCSSPNRFTTTRTFITHLSFPNLEFTIAQLNPNSLSIGHTTLCITDSLQIQAVVNT